MGLTDKIKVSVKNASSKLSEEADVISINSKISSKKKENEKLYRDLGEYIYSLRGTIGKVDRDHIKDVSDRIDRNLKDISNLEAEIKTMKEQGHNERESNWNNAQ